MQPTQNCRNIVCNSIDNTCKHKWKINLSPGSDRGFRHWSITLLGSSPAQPHSSALKQRGWVEFISEIDVQLNWSIWELAASLFTSIHRIAKWITTMCSIRYINIVIFIYLWKRNWYYFYIVHDIKINYFTYYDLISIMPNWLVIIFLL